MSERPDKTTLLRDLDAGRTLHAPWYTEPEIYEHEQRAIFGRSWQYAGAADMVSQPGQFITGWAGRLPYLVARGEGGTLRAFVNVCPHRGTHLVPERCGQRNAIQCSYHAWTFGLDGTLLAAPGAKEEPDFRPAELGLMPMLVSTWGPWVFINPDCEADSLESTLTDLPGLTASTGVRLDQLKAGRQRLYTIAANWKVVVENYLECYHCPTAHPSFCDMIDVRGYTVREYELFSIQTAPAKESRASGDAVREGFYAFLWPNFTINLYPGAGNVSVNLFRPLDEHNTLALFEYYFPPGISDTEAETFVAFVDQVQREDTALCEAVQVGLRSGGFQQGRLMKSRERALHHFQKLVAGTL
jgi:phenylpropionate dioxygenase-like ring-hydroxylating dioxygenase large terminal subunit